jgi:hypothetical protein
MTNKVYRTAQGKMIDMGALQLQNEKVRAVGNMNVNARGDTVNEKNEVIDRKIDKVGRKYDQQVVDGKAHDAPVIESSAVGAKPAQEPVVDDDPLGPMDQEPVDQQVENKKDDGFSLT